ncbi:MAG TPA: hypothetical protein VGX94_17055, partial [Terriglobia bacterium]|nr:hypothetical protein [Terriglobia bacterium]
ASTESLPGCSKFPSGEEAGFSSSDITVFSFRNTLILSVGLNPSQRDPLDLRVDFPPRTLAEKAGKLKPQSAPESKLFLSRLLFRRISKI